MAIRQAAAGRRASLRFLVADAPDAAAGVVADQQAAVGGHGESDGPAPDFGWRTPADPEAGEEVFVIARGLPILERHPHDLVAGRLARIARSVELHEGLAPIVRRKHP